MCMYVCLYVHPPHPPPACFLILAKPLRSASYLTCILRGSLLTYLPTTEAQNHKGITTECLLLQSQLTPCQPFSPNAERLPVARMEKSDFIHRPNASRPSRVFVNLMVALVFDPSGCGRAARLKDRNETYLSAYLSTSRTNREKNPAHCY